jgi:hypothetical protein
MVGATLILGQEAVREADITQILLILLAVVVAGLAAGLWTWWFTTYVVDGDELRVDTGLLFKRTRHIRLSRLQAVDVVQPLVARILGSRWPAAALPKAGSPTSPRTRRRRCGPSSSPGPPESVRTPRQRPRTCSCGCRSAR